MIKDSIDDNFQIDHAKEKLSKKDIGQMCSGIGTWLLEISQ
jgi:hypothetical protein